MTDIPTASNPSAPLVTAAGDIVAHATAVHLQPVQAAEVVGKHQIEWEFPLHCCQIGGTALAAFGF